VTIDIHDQGVKSVVAGATITVKTIVQEGGLKYVRGNIYFPAAGTLIIRQQNYLDEIVDTTTASVTAAGGLTFNILAVANTIRVWAKNDTGADYTIRFEIILEYED